MRGGGGGDLSPKEKAFFLQLMASLRDACSLNDVTVMYYMILFPMRCSTTVQHGNWLKIYPKKTLLYHFLAETAMFRGSSFAI